MSVAIQQDGAEDPIRELLQVYDQLLPQVPRLALALTLTLTPTLTQPQP